jgi:hypothetical protein
MPEPRTSRLVKANISRAMSGPHVRVVGSYGRGGLTEVKMQKEKEKEKRYP